MSPRRRNIVVGLVVLVGLGVIVWMVLLFSGRLARLATGTGMPFTIKADRADGLSDGSSIIYKGLQAGRVTGIALNPDNVTVSIACELDKGKTLPGNLVGVIRILNPLSSSGAISLEVKGKPEGLLRSGAILDASYEGSSIIPKQFTQLAEDLKQQKLIEHLDQTVVSIREQSDRAGKLLDGLQQLIGDPKVRNELHEALANIDAVTVSATRIAANLERFSIKLDKVTDETDGVMSSAHVAVAKLGKTLDNLQSVTQKIDQGKGTAGLLVNDAKLYQGLVDTTKELNMTVADLRRVVHQWEQEGVSLKLGK